MTLIFTTCKYSMVMFSVVSVCNALTFESFDQKLSLLYAGTP